MSGRTATHLAQLETQWEELLDLVRPLSPEALRSRPRSGGWSTLEILEHLVLAEAVILQGLPPWAELVAQPRTPLHRGKLLLVRLVLALGIPVKAPSRRMIPTGTLDLEAVAARWEGHRRWLQAFLAEAGSGTDQLPLFRHPVAGPISLRQALGLDLRHHRVHQRQVRERLLAFRARQGHSREGHP